MVTSNYSLVYDGIQSIPGRVITIIVSRLFKVSLNCDAPDETKSFFIYSYVDVKIGFLVSNSSRN